MRVILSLQKSLQLSAENKEKGKITMIKDVKKDYIRQVPSSINFDDFENIDLLFNTPNNYSVLSEYQLESIKEVRMHNYSPKNEYNLDGEIISEEEIIGSNGNFYTGFYSEIAYLQLRIVYQCDDFTIIRYRSADKDSIVNEWNSDIKFIVFHNKQFREEAEVNTAFKCLMAELDEYVYKAYTNNDYFNELDDLEIIDEDLDELEEL